ncbi:MAG: response regulator [Pseudomonadota bacterium]
MALPVCSRRSARPAAGVAAVNVQTHITEPMSAALATLTSHEGERQALSIFDKSPIGFAQLSLDGRIHAVNDSFCRICQRERTQLIDHHLDKITLAESRSSLMAAIGRHMAGDPSEHFDTRFLGPDGRISWARIYTSLVRDLFGKPLHLVLLAQDTSTSTLAEMCHHRCDVRLRAAIDGARLGVFHWDLVTKSVELSDTARAYLGLAADEPATLAAAKSALHPQDQRKVHAAISAALADASSFSLQCRTIWRSGSVHWLSIIGNVVKDSFSQATCIEGVVIDIDEKIAHEAASAQREAAMQTNADQLEKTNLLLATSIAELQAATDAKTTFLANMSHEIRTPLNAIIGFTHLLKIGGATSEQDAHLDRITTASKHLLEVINAVLDIAKIEAGEITLQHEPINLREIVAGVQAIIQLQANEKELAIHVDIRPPNCILMGDSTRLLQSLLNYAKNAVEFTTNGFVNLRVFVKDEDEESVLLQFDVQDSGGGIPPESIHRLFHRFEQANHPSVPIHTGSGLGLAITQQLASQMGGSAGAQSEPGVGSTFWFTARLRKTVSASPASIHQALNDVTDALIQAHSYSRILLVEDDPMSREVAEALLGTVALTVDIAHDGIEAVQMAEKFSYDLVLMDVQMPDMDGLEATRRIRRLADGQTLPIIALTANAFSRDRTACLDAGMDAVITKPIEPFEFFSTLRQWLQPKARPRAHA